MIRKAITFTVIILGLYSIYKLQMLNNNKLGVFLIHFNEFCILMLCSFAITYYGKQVTYRTQGIHFRLSACHTFLYHFN